MIVRQYAEIRTPHIRQYAEITKMAVEIEL